MRPDGPWMLVAGGSDPLAYSGVDADLRHLRAMGMRGEAAVAVRTIQALDAVVRLEGVAPWKFRAALAEALARAPVAVKIGMLHREGCVHALADVLAGYPGPVVVDPVLGASSGTPLLDAEGVQALKRRLLPLTALVTPNWSEARTLTGLDDPVSAAARLMDWGATAVLIKGGHRPSAQAEDLLCTRGGVRAFPRRRIPGGTPRGTGCALATLIALGLGRGESLQAAVGGAGDILHRAIAACATRGTRFLVIDPSGAANPP